MRRKYNIYFFHLLINIEADRDSLKWILYKSSKLFLRFPGVFTERGSPRHWRISGTGDQRCTELGGDCVALERRSTSKYSYHFPKIFKCLERRQSPGECPCCWTTSTWTPSR